MSHSNKSFVDQFNEHNRIFNKSKHLCIHDDYGNKSINLESGEIYLFNLKNDSERIWEVNYIDFSNELVHLIRNETVKYSVAFSSLIVIDSGFDNYYLKEI